MTGETAFHEGDEQGLTVWQRLDACDRAILQLTARTELLVRQYTELQKRVDALVADPRNGIVELEERVIRLEQRNGALNALLDSSKLASYPTQKPPADLTQFNSIEALVQQVELMFDCQDGDYCAYHTVHTDTPQGVGRDVYMYTNLALIAPASASHATDRLRQMFYAGFQKLKKTCKSQRPVLYWRYAAAERIAEETEYQQAQGCEPVPYRYKIRTRFAIPEADFSVVSELVHQEGTPITNVVWKE
jgi:hypothetical protein